MKRITFLLLVITSMCLCGCSWFDRPANVEVLGLSSVQNDHGLLVIEINSQKYAPYLIYKGISNPRANKEKMSPIGGMRVTCFTMHGNPNIEFIAGEYDQASLEKYFCENYTFMAVSGVLCILILILWLITTAASKRKKAKKKA